MRMDDAVQKHTLVSEVWLKRAVVDEFPAVEALRLDTTVCRIAIKAEDITGR
jgi:hypothetical protein